MLTLKNLKSPRGANKNSKRIGRGQGSGQGTQAGKGHKGQNARTGGNVRTAFEGNGLPLYMRLPKRGFKNAPFKVEYAIVNLGDLSTHYSNEVVSRETLIEKGLLKGNDKSKPLKVLGKGELSKGLSFEGIDKFSENALKAVQKAGGKVLKNEGK